MLLDAYIICRTPVHHKFLSKPDFAMSNPVQAQGNTCENAWAYA